MPETGFVLDQRLAGDTLPVGDLPLSRLLLSRDANWPWLILVPRRRDVSEIIELSEPERTRLMEEISRVCEALRAEVACDKLNVAALGNMVAQLHVHVIARTRTDSAWPKPVWGQAAAIAYAPDEASALIARLRRRLDLPEARA